MLSLDDAAALDAQDPLAGFRDRFVLDPLLTYLDGNSLGALPLATAHHLGDVVAREWGQRLIRSWNEGWMELPGRVGDLIGAHLLGAAPGQVVLSDSTTVNLYKVVAAALDARPGRRVIVGDAASFPTDRYVVDGLAHQRGLQVRSVEPDDLYGPQPGSVAAAVGDDTAVVVLSHVDYRSGALADMAAITEVVHAAGALMVWDVSHSVGVVPVALDVTGTDFAVGCTYKYLNGGPGSPSFLYVRSGLHGTLRQPIWGWFGQRDQFDMGPEYRPVDGIARFLTGTPSVLAASAVESSVTVLAEAGIAAIRAKSVALTSWFVECADERLAGLGFELGSPRDPAQRGGHVTLRHPEAYRICRVLVDDERTVPDFRAPDGLRVGLSPMTTRFTDVWHAVDAIRRVATAGRFRAVDAARLRVT